MFQMSFTVWKNNPEDFILGECIKFEKWEYFEENIQLKTGFSYIIGNVQSMD